MYLLRAIRCALHMRAYVRVLLSDHSSVHVYMLYYRVGANVMHPTLNALDYVPSNVYGLYG